MTDAEPAWVNANFSTIEPDTFSGLPVMPSGHWSLWANGQLIASGDGPPPDGVALTMGDALIPESEHAEALVDLARHGREQEFRDLAAAVGVAAARINGLWAGTRARVRQP
jgi:hypothetical protein